MFHKNGLLALLLVWNEEMKTKRKKLKLIHHPCFFTSTHHKWIPEAPFPAEWLRNDAVGHIVVVIEAIGVDR